MSLLTKILIALVALEHLYFLYFEMFRWTNPKTLKLFGMTEEFAQQSKSLAANQGLYNGFLAAGLIWSLLAAPETGVAIARFFLACVAIAGIYGGMTVTRRILWTQAVPALVAVSCTFVA